MVEYIYARLSLNFVGGGGGVYRCKVVPKFCWGGGGGGSISWLNICKVVLLNFVVYIVVEYMQGCA